MSYLIDNGAHIDAALTNMAVKGFDGDMDGYIADKLFPKVPVAKQSDYYFIINQAEYMRIPDTRRAPGVPAKHGEWSISSAQYFCDNYAFGTDYPLELLSQADVGAAFIRQSNMDYVLETLARAREQRVANIVTSISNVGSGATLAGTNKWSNGTSDPVGDIQSACAFVLHQTGIMPNAMAVDYDTMQVLSTHPEIRDYVKYTTAGPVPTEEMARLFKVENIYTAFGVYNSAKEGATQSLQNIWPNFASVCYVQPGVSMQTTTFGLAFRWTPAEFPAPLVVERYLHHDRSAKLEVQEAQYFQKEVVVARNLIYTYLGTL